MVFKVASYRVPAAARDEFSKVVGALIAAAKSKPGVVGYRGGFDLDDSEVFTLTGLYDSEQVFEKHASSDYLQSAVRKVNALSSQGVQFMDAASFEADEQQNSRKAHVQQMLRA